MAEGLTVQQLIEHLSSFPPDLPVQVKTYGFGGDSWTDVTETMICDMVNDQDVRICEIAADWN